MKITYDEKNDELWVEFIGGTHPYNLNYVRCNAPLNTSIWVDDQSNIQTIKISNASKTIDMSSLRLVHMPFTKVSSTSESVPGKEAPFHRQ